MGIENYEKEYLELWGMREEIFDLPKDKNWDDYGELSKRINSKINNFFERIANLDIGDKVQVLNKINERCKILRADDDLIRRILKEDHFRGRKFEMLLAYSTSTALQSGIKKIDFDLRKEPGQCNCHLMQEIDLIIHERPSNGLELIYDNSESIYDAFELYKCLECEVFWINDLYSDDGPARGWRSPRHEFELRLIEGN